MIGAWLCRIGRHRRSLCPGSEGSGIAGFYYGPCHRCGINPDGVQ